MKPTPALFLLLVACGGGGNHGVDASHGGDANPDGSSDGRVFLDAPPSVPPMITISGVASEDTQNGSSPLVGVAVSLFKTSDETTAIASATTDAQGHYTFMVATGGVVVDAFINATKSGYVDNDVYPAAPFQADTSQDVNMITTGNYGLLKFLSGQHDGNGLIVIEVTDATDTAVQGATVSSSPASGNYRYSDSNGIPTATTATNTDGAAFMFDVPPGQVTISAMKSGSTFKSHALDAHANVFTNTVITE